uniref:Protein kinase domain-containing protein n=1 Tax=Plectus sambesii TaxID=2011161 RepID=A0A914VYG6_9BILA
MNYLLALLVAAVSDCLFIGVLGRNVAEEYPSHHGPPPPKFRTSSWQTSSAADTSVEIDNKAPPPPHGWPQPGPPPGAPKMPPPYLIDNWSRCDFCPPNTLLALFIFSTVMDSSKFEMVKYTWKTVYESCALGPNDMRVSYMVPGKYDVAAEWAYNSSSFKAMRDTLKVNAFQLKEMPESENFESMIKRALKAAQAGLPPEPNSSNPSVKEILIITDFDLYLKEKDADEVLKSLKSDRFDIRYLWLPNGGEALPKNKYTNNLNTIIDPRWPKYVSEWSELNLTDTIHELASCLGDPGPPPPNGYYVDALKPSKGNTEWIMAVSIIAGVVFITAILAVLCITYKRVRYRYKEKMERYQAEARNQAAIPNHYQDLERRDEWTIPKERLEVMFDQKLGAGAFSNVFKGKLSGTAPVCTIYSSVQATRSYTDCDVAVKILPTFADDMAKSDFIQEINFMKSLGYHPHLICMLGMVWEKLDEPRLVIEYCNQGDLLHFIREKKSEIVNGYANTSGLKLKDLLSYSWQISDGMDYLASKGCIHRDLAARNIFLDYTNTAKIGDFGLCRLTDRSLYTTRGGRLPIKWMAIESLKSYEYSFKSDVWSFGVLLFELFSLGDVPFPRVQPADMIDHLDSGARLHQPPFCPNEIYSIMCCSWLADPRLRPPFEIIRNDIAKMLERATENYGYLPVENGEYISVVDLQNVDNIARELQNYRVDQASNSITTEDSVDPSEPVNDALD